MSSPAHNPDADGPKFDYRLSIDYPNEGGLTLTSGVCGPDGMHRLLHGEADQVRRLYPQWVTGPAAEPARPDVCPGCGHLRDSHRLVGGIKPFRGGCMKCRCDLFGPPIRTPVADPARPGDEDTAPEWRDVARFDLAATVPRAPVEALLDVLDNPDECADPAAAFSDALADLRRHLDGEMP